MKILNFGSCNIDYVYDLEHIVVPGETLSSKQLSIFPGGKGLNQSIAAAKAGANVYHAGCIGTDGRMLETLLAENGVNVTHLKTLDAKTGHAIIQLSEDGENCIFLYGGCNELIEESFVDEVLDTFDEGDILLLQNEINGIGYIVEKAYARGMVVVFNPAPFKEEVKTIDFGKLSYVILNEIEAKGLAGKDTAEENIVELRKRYPDLKIVLTVGAKGCIYSDKEQTLYHPSFQVTVKDTTAAGDTFIGYFIASLVSGKTVMQALKTASAASAITVSRKGASVSIPSAIEVEETLPSLKPNVHGGNRTEELREKIVTYLDENLREANLKGLARMLGYSEEYAGILVKRSTGKLFSVLLREKRCAQAEKLLTETDLPVQEIIYRCGYENESFFRKVFKETYGKLPFEYRKYKKGEFLL